MKAEEGDTKGQGQVWADSIALSCSKQVGQLLGSLKSDPHIQQSSPSIGQAARLLRLKYCGSQMITAS